MRRGALFVLSGPSGVGKSTIRQRLLKRLDLVYSISYTTRKRRPGEKDGRDYHFVGRKVFERLVRQGEFLEWARVFGECYGTPKRAVLEHIRAGRDVLLEIDVQGAEQIRRKRTLRTKVHFIFVLPPSLEALRERLVKRATEVPTALRARWQGALLEISQAPHFEYLVVNRDLSSAVEALARFISFARDYTSPLPRRCSRSVSAACPVSSLNCASWGLSTFRRESLT